MSRGTAQQEEEQEPRSAPIRRPRRAAAFAAVAAAAASSSSSSDEDDEDGEHEIELSKCIDEAHKIATKDVKKVKDRLLKRLELACKDRSTNFDPNKAGFTPLEYEAFEKELNPDKYEWDNIQHNQHMNYGVPYSEEEYYLVAFGIRMNELVANQPWFDEKKHSPEHIVARAKKAFGTSFKLYKRHVKGTIVKQDGTLVRKQNTDLKVSMILEHYTEIVEYYNVPANQKQHTAEVKLAVIDELLGRNKGKSFTINPYILPFYWGDQLKEAKALIALFNDKKKKKSASDQSEQQQAGDDDGEEGTGGDDDDGGSGNGGSNQSGQQDIKGKGGQRIYYESFGC